MAASDNLLANPAIVMEVPHIKIAVNVMRARLTVLGFNIAVVFFSAGMIANPARWRQPFRVRIPGPRWFAGFTIAGNSRVHGGYRWVHIFQQV
jgi:hypothetical protein